MLRQLPKTVDANLLVGFETRDDAGVFALSDDMALVQTVDFFTPVVDDPYDYGQIAAANALSDVYAMGGRPLTALNIACFNPMAAPAEVWSQVLLGMHDKTIEAGALVLGGHSVEDNEPKFGMAVTGVVNPASMFANTGAVPGDDIYLSKPLGTGIVLTGGKNDLATKEEVSAAVESMKQLNRAACDAALTVGVRCATDITGFGLAGHLWNIARASGVAIEVSVSSLPLLPGVQRLVGLDQATGGGVKNRKFIGAGLTFDDGVADWMRDLVCDPQTSGGLALFTAMPFSSYPRIGQVIAGEPGIHFVP